MVRKKKVALLLSSGSAKGFAHLGVLKVLEKNKIPIDLIIGTSMGSFIGASYSMLPDAGYWENQIKKISLKDVLNIKDFEILNGGIMKGKGIEKILKKTFGDATFKETLIPLIINSVNFTKRECIKIDKGKLREAVRISVSIPALFQGVKKNNEMFVDGGVMDPIGVKWLKGKWDLVIVVNVNTAQNSITNNSPIHFFLRMIELLQREMVRDKIKNIENIVLIEPDMTGLSQVDFHKLKQFVKRGEEAGEKAMRKIKEKLKI